MKYTLLTLLFALGSLLANATTGIIAGPSIICNGQSATYTNEIAGGVWTISAPTVASINASSGVLFAVNPGTAIITYTASETVVFKTVTVATLPSPVAGMAPLCVGQSIALSSMPSGGAWSSSNASTAAIDAITGVVTGIAPGTATITYTGTNTCFSSAVVTVWPAPTDTIAGPAGVCMGSSAAYSCVPTGGTWSSSVAGTITSTGIFTAITTGTATITYRTSPACYTTKTVTMHPLPSVILGPLVLCQGDSLVLSAPGGGTWMSATPAVGTVSTSGVITTGGVGTMVLTYTLPTGCYVTRVFTVNGAPSEISGNRNICAGTTSLLSSSPAGGTWISSNPGVVTISGSTGEATALAGGGTATISYTLGTGCRTTAVVTTHAIPMVIVGTAEMCTGTTVNLIGLGGGTWSSSNEAIGTVSATGVVTGISAGNTNITFTSMAGCTRTNLVIVHPLPAPITGPSSVCTGQSAFYTSTSIGGIWTSSNPSVLAIEGSGAFAGSSAGLAVLSYMLGTGCVTTRTVSVLPSPAPPIGTLGVCVGTTTTLIAPAGPAGTWSSASAAISVSATGVVTGLAAGTGGVTYTIPTGCYQVVVVTVNAVAGGLDGDAHICLGTSSQLVHAVTGGTWTSSNASVATVSSTGLVSGVGIGTAHINYTSPGGTCSGAAIVTVNAAPTAISGPTGFCNFTTATYTSSPSGGTWSSSDPSIAGITSSSTGIVTAHAVGMATISYSLAGCTVTKNISIVSTPSNGSLELGCAGGTVQLTNSIGGGTWASAHPAVATVNGSTGLVNALTLGTAIVTYQLLSGCTSVYTVNVPVAQPTISGTLSFCGSVGTTLTASASGGSWLSGSSSVATVGYTTGVVTGVLAGMAPITYTSPYDCRVVATVTVQAAASPFVTGPSTIGMGGNGSYNVSALGPVWSSSATGVLTINASGVATAITQGVTTISCSAPCGVYTKEVTVTRPIATYSVVPSADTACLPAHFYLAIYGADTSWAVVSQFGDGSSSVYPLNTGSAHIYHAYGGPGTYTVRHLVFKSGVPVDSVTFSYVHQNCNVMRVRYFNDANLSCIREGGETWSTHPITTRVDSAGVTVASITATSGFYYKARGGAGTIYQFTPIAMGSSVALSCPSSPLLSDTVGIFEEVHIPRDFGLQCTTPAGVYDLSVNVAANCSLTNARYDIVVRNSMCTPVSPVVTLNVSPHYQFQSATILPTSISGTTITWALPPLSLGATSVRTFSVYFTRPSGLGPVPPGTLIPSQVLVGPTSGDYDTTNNEVIRTDTARGAWDPNDITVTPEGYILPCTELTYRVRFENMGNAPARNVTIIDTLNDGLDPATLAPVVASHPMDIAIYAAGGHNVVRFDFPDIYLPDASHPNDNKGMVFYTIKARAGLADGTEIQNRAGIFFDDNPVVMTNEVHNITGMPPIAGPDTVCAGTSVTLTNMLAGGTWSISGISATILGSVVTGHTVGESIVTYEAANACTLRRRTHTVYVDTIPVVAPLTGTTHVCAGSTTLWGTTTGNGVWHSANVAVATVMATGLVTGEAAGTAIISYTVSNSCGTTAQTDTVTVQPMVTPSVTVTTDATPIVCFGTNIRYTATALHGGDAPQWQWYKYGELVPGTTTDTFTYIPGIDEFIEARLTSSAACVTDTHAIAGTVVAVTALTTPQISTARIPMGRLCQGTVVTLNATISGGGTAPVIWWTKNGAIVGTGLTFSYMPNDGDMLSAWLDGDEECSIFDTVGSLPTSMQVDSSFIPTVSISVTPGLFIAPGTTDTFTAVAANAGPAPRYQWLLNSVEIPGATSFRYITNTLADGDSVSCVVSGGSTCTFISFNSVKVRVSPVYTHLAEMNSAIVVSPNPGSGTFRITGSVTGATTATILVADVLGRQVLMTPAEVLAGEISQTIMLPQALAPGTYLLQLVTDAGRYTTRLLLQP